MVSSHCHVSPLWYEPIETLIDQMGRNGVRQAVLVQLLGQYDNRYQQSSANADPDRFASVIAVDPAAPDACDILIAHAEAGAAGVRLRPEARSPGADPLAIWRTAQARGLAVSCVGQARQFSAPEFFDLIEALPDLPIVLEHLGGGSRAGETPLEERRRVFEAGRFPNVYLKAPGLGELVVRPRTLPGQETLLEHRVRELDEALERFGPERLMWASDFPVVSSREGYANALDGLRRAIGADAQAHVLGGTARRVFKLPHDDEESMP